jgi:hypothetical protein
MMNGGASINDHLQQIPNYQRSKNSDLEKINDLESNEDFNKKGCGNCDRLRGQGLSSKFCLDHSIDNFLSRGSPKRMVCGGAEDDSQQVKNSVPIYNEDLGCHVIYIDDDDE